MTARIAAAIDGYSWTEQNQANLELVLASTDSVSTLVRSIDGSLAYDTLVAAGARVWGNGAQTMRLLEGEERELRVVAAGVAKPREVRVSSTLTASAGFYLPSRRA